MIWTKRIVFSDGHIVEPERVLGFSMYFETVQYTSGQAILTEPMNGCVCDEFTGFSDKNKTPIYENDLFLFAHPYITQSDKPQMITAVAEWDVLAGTWLLHADGAFRVPLARYARRGTVTGRYTKKEEV